KPGVRISHRQSLLCWSAVRGVSSSLYWRSWRDSPLEVHHGRPWRGADPPRALRAQGPVGAPVRSAEFESCGEATRIGRVPQACGSCRSGGRTKRAHKLRGNHRTVSTATTGLIVIGETGPSDNGTGAPAPVKKTAPAAMPS